MRFISLLNCCIVKFIVGSNNNREMKDLQKGQILLISLLVLTIALTIGLSVATRAITTTRITSAGDSSMRAFLASEAGIERALTSSVDSIITGSFSDNNSSYNVEKKAYRHNENGEILLENDALISQDNSADIWLSDYPNYTNPWTGGLTIYWGNKNDVCDDLESTNSMAAVEIILIRGGIDNPIIDHFAYDPCDVRRGSNNFANPNSGNFNVAGKEFAYSGDEINITLGLLARVVPLYAGTQIGVKGVGLPPQGSIITSIGKSGGTQRKIVSFRGYPKLPIELFPFLIFSP